MRKKIWTIAVLIILTMALITGCGGSTEQKVEGNDNPTIEENTQSDNTSEANTDITIVAKEQGVSKKEMESMIDELTQMTAEKYGSTKEEYIQMLESDGKTPLDEFKTAADYMGITIKEYYEYEKNNTANMTDEQRETMAGMNEAMKELQNLDISGLDADVEEAQDVINGLTGAGDRVATGDYKEIGHYEVGEIIKEEEHLDAGVYELKYSSTADTADIVDYFKELLEGTPNYLCIEIPGGLGAQISGTVNGATVAATIDNEDGDGTTIVDYGYMGDLVKK